MGNLFRQCLLNECISESEKMNKAYYVPLYLPIQKGNIDNAYAFFSVSVFSRTSETGFASRECSKVLMFVILFFFFATHGDDGDDDDG